MKNDGSEASPSKAVVSELQDLRAELRESASSYAARLDAEIERVSKRWKQRAVNRQAPRSEISAICLPFCGTGSSNRTRDGARISKKSKAS